MLFLDFYDFGSLFLFLIDKVGIYLGGADVLVGKHLADGVDVCASGYEQCGVGVAEAMEGDVFVDSGGLNPFFQPSVDELACEALEYFAFGRSTAEFECLVTDGDGSFGIGLLCLDADAFTARWIVLDVVPFELEDVAQPESGEAGKQRGGFEDGVVAVRVRNFLEFFLCEVFPLCLLGFYLVKVVIYILFQVAFFEGDGKECAECAPVSCG